jgi:GNAT superfamily N-acetyltransferase
MGVIRTATIEDCETIAALGRVFHAEALWGEVAPYDEADCLKALTVLREQGIVLALEEEGEIVGMAGGMVFPLYFNHAHLTGSEMFLWVRPDRRGGSGIRLLIALEDAARAKGCASWGMALMSALNPEKTEQFYLRRGYRPHERTFVKVF